MPQGDGKATGDESGGGQEDANTKDFVATQSSIQDHDYRCCGEQARCPYGTDPRKTLGTCVWKELAVQEILFKDTIAQAHAQGPMVVLRIRWEWTT